LYGRYKETLLVVIAQDDKNKILLIAFVVVEGKTTKTWLLFLKNFKRHVTPQNDLCLILDKHESIKIIYSRRDSRWMT